jgi:glutamate formiminotransferase/formiminotetrahydrofolate cyclodeaminase
MNQLIECVPNFSEGRDMGIIKQITDQIESVEGVKLLDVDPGKATNRTVVTMVGEPEAVLEAAFLAVKKRLRSSTCAAIKESIPGLAPQMFVRLFR